MDRRSFVLAASSALPVLGCSFGRSRQAEGASAFDLGQVQGLTAERLDPLWGRCAYRVQAGPRSALQPVLFARRGERVALELRNRLPQPTAFHWHGLLVPEAADGAGFSPLLPGESRDLSFTVDQRAGLYWLHAHAHGFTAEQVYAGLVLPLRVSDDEDEALARELQLAPANQKVLVLADARVRGDAVLPYAPAAADCVLGWLGNRVRVNGAFDPALDCAAGWLRLQLVNASNARGFLLALRSGGRDLPFHLMGTDGGLLAAPVELERVFLHPAERVDLALPLAAGQSVELLSRAFDARVQVESLAPATLVHPSRAQWPTLAASELCSPSADSRERDSLPDGAAMPIATIRAHAQPRPRVPMPARLSSLSAAPDTSGWPLRRIRLDAAGSAGFVIDGAAFSVNEVGWRVERGAREVWEIRASPIGMPHPVHLHGAGFRVLRRQGTQGPARALASADRGRLPTDLGIKDTVTVWPGETVWLAVDFALPANPAFAGAQRYLFHCHNLEHEDAMMMRLVTVT